MWAARIVVLMAACLLAGAGCDKQAAEVKQEITVSGVRPLTVGNLAPAELTKKVNLMRGNVLTVKQSVPESAAVFAQALNLAREESAKEAVIRRFAPGNLAEVEWRSPIKAATSTRTVNGAVTGSDLKLSHFIFLPALWKEGDANAYGSSLLWLSAEVYENLTRSGLSTFDFGLLDNNLLAQAKTHDKLKQEVSALQIEAGKALNRTDIYLTRVSEPKSEWPLKINGVDAKVEVMKAGNWFGEMVVLLNPQNPLVLKVKLKDLPGAPNLSRLLDYEVTELRDLKE